MKSQKLEKGSKRRRVQMSYRSNEVYNYEIFFNAVINPLMEDIEIYGLETAAEQIKQECASLNEKIPTNNWVFKRINHRATNLKYQVVLEEKHPFIKIMDEVAEYLNVSLSRSAYLICNFYNRGDFMSVESMADRFIDMELNPEDSYFFNEWLNNSKNGSIMKEVAEIFIKKRRKLQPVKKLYRSYGGCEPKDLRSYTDSEENAKKWNDPFIKVIETRCYMDLNPYYEISGSKSLEKEREYLVDEQLHSKEYVPA